AVVMHLANAGPSLADELRGELQWDAKRFRAARAKLEKFGALVAYSRVVHGAWGGHRHVGELFRWDQRYEDAPNNNDSTDDALDDLVVAAVHAAVVAPTTEVKRWFSWPLPRDTVARLVEQGWLEIADEERVTTPADGRRRRPRRQ